MDNIEDISLHKIKLYFVNSFTIRSLSSNQMFTSVIIKILFTDLVPLSKTKSLNHGEPNNVLIDIGIS